ncbi:hypothetical protein GRS66_006959 [Saccharomyces pastorianus]|uniref:Uncharacterized protein n=1 Tax=Saccharomyces pastorianus TaxID=27292 RepID=A0A6C1E527_SACPS|nr:hypothetical protein GRS66_006959 [Saccharomyces pastorianus]
MKLIDASGEKLFRELMNWEEQQGNMVAIGYALSSDGNPNGLTVQALDESNAVKAELTVYGENAVGPWLKAAQAQHEEWDRQLAEQSITPDQYGVGYLSCPKESMFQ